MRRQFDAKSKLTRALYLAYMYAGQRSLPRLLCHLQVLGLVPVNLLFCIMHMPAPYQTKLQSSSVHPSIRPSV